MSDFWRRFRRNRGAVVGLVILALVFAMAALASLLFPGSPWDMAAAPFAPPGEDGMLLGSDSLGRDVAAGIAHGARVSLMVGGGIDHRGAVHRRHARRHRRLSRRLGG